MNRMDFYKLEIGRVSNLIADMTLKGASVEEIEVVVEYSKQLIDTAKESKYISSLEKRWGRNSKED